MSLCKTAIESAAVATQNYDARNMAIVPGQNTPLATLVNEVYVDSNPVNQSGQYQIDTKAMIDITNAADPILGFSEYCQKEDEIATVIAEHLQSHIYGFKTQVAPMVDAYAERLNERVAMLEGNPDNGAQVLKWSRATPFQEPSLVESFMRSKDVGVRNPPLEMKLPELTGPEISGYMRTGNASIDASISDYFNSFGDDWVANAWKRVFTSDTSNLSVGNLNVYINGRNEGVAYALFVFLVARRLWDNPIDGIDMPLNKYTHLMGEYRDQAAQRLCREMELADREADQGMLIRDVIKNGKGETAITVDEGLYKDFLKQGGTNEMLLANALLDAPMKSIKDILDSKETLARRWASYYSMNMAYFEQKRLTHIKNAMLAEWDHMVRGMSDDDFPIEQRQLSRNLLIDFSRSVKLDDMDCIKTLALKAVCRSRFHATHAEMFLSTMERAQRDNPDLTPAEAAYVASVEYVSRWAASQMKLVGAKSVTIF